MDNNRQLTPAEQKRKEVFDAKCEEMYAKGYTKSDLTFSVGSRENVDKLTSQLKSDGYSVLSGPRVTGDGYYESCVLGFENNLIEITE